MTRILCVPNAFKESLTSTQAARIMAAAARRAWPRAAVQGVPVADGGDGTLDALVAGTSGRTYTALVHGPLGAAVRARYGLSGDGTCGFVEMARASGLARVPPGERDVMSSSTRGTGELILRLLDRGVREIVVGVGGSATVDGGTGACAALGARFLDRRGRAIPEGGGGLAALARIDPAGLDPRLSRVRLRVACDVTNPLTGTHGAARVFGPQKGASAREVLRLERGLRRVATVCRRDLGRDPGSVRGAGAAGGLAGGLWACCGARLEQGADLILGLAGIEPLLRWADLVVVAEGRLDASSWHGKAPVVTARAARRAGARVLAVCGSCDPAAGARFAREFEGAVFPLVPSAALATEGRRNAAAWLGGAVEQAVRAVRCGARIERK